MSVFDIHRKMQLLLAKSIRALLWIMHFTNIIPRYLQRLVGVENKLPTNECFENTFLRHLYTPYL